MTEKPLSSRAKPTPSIPLVCYFYGAEDLLLEEAVDAIKAKALSGGLDAFNLDVFDQASFNPSKIIMAAETLPAFSDKRVVIVKDAEALKAKDIAVLGDYVKNPSPGTCLIFISKKDEHSKKKGGEPDFLQDFLKIIAAKGLVKEFKKLNPDAMHEWIKKTVVSMGKTVTPTAVQRLIALSSGRLRELKSELEKIVLFTGEKKEIDLCDVEDAGLDCKEETAFALCDAIGAKDTTAAIKVLSKLSDEEPIMILGTLSWHIRTLFKVKLLREKRVSMNEISNATRLYGDRLDKYLGMTRLFGVQELDRAIEKLQDADTGMKTGRLPQRLLLSQLIIELCGGLRLTKSGAVGSKG
ncbi:DNA polymerase III subunit delta [bacterium]|nr:MAG: DNA polymerase III subunit delta [bacterium]